LQSLITLVIYVREECLAVLVALEFHSEDKNVPHNLFSETVISADAAAIVNGELHNLSESAHDVALKSKQSVVQSYCQHLLEKSLFQRTSCAGRPSATFAENRFVRTNTDFPDFIRQLSQVDDVRTFSLSNSKALNSQVTIIQLPISQKTLSITRF